MDNYLKIISNLKVKPLTKLRILSRFLPSQFSFELRIYNFSSTWISENIDALCVRFIRDWIEAPISLCVKEWLITPSVKCGLGIPSFQFRAERLKLQKRKALKCSVNEKVRDLWIDSSTSSIVLDSLLLQYPFKQAQNVQRSQLTTSAADHFLNLGK